MDYLVHIAVMTCLYVILTASFNLLIGFAGLFALAHAGFYAFGAYAVAILSMELGLPFPLPLLAGAALTALVGAFVALPALRIGGHYLVIITLAFHVILLAVILNWKELTGGPDGLAGIPQIELFGWRVADAYDFLPLALVMAGLCLAVCWRVAHSPFGRALKAMRENEAAAEAVGKNIVYMKVAAFMIAAALAAVAGGLFARYVTFVGVESFGIDETIYVLAMVILGGTANLWGSVLGAVLLVVLPELLKFLDLPPDIADKSRQIIYGLLLIVILRVRPQGLLPERDTTSRMRALTEVTRPAGGAAVPAETAAPAPGTVVLSGEALTRRFGGIVAVDGFDIALESGRIVGLIGPNGAGKTTAFNLLTGFLKPTSGRVRLRGRDVTGMKPHELVRAGIARSFQDLKLFTRLTVLENVLVAVPRQSGDGIAKIFFAPGRVRREEAANRAKAMAVLDFVGLRDKADELAESLSYAEEKLLVVARLLATEAEVLLFDEPLSGLDPTTLQRIFPTIRRLAEQGKTVCIIEHNLDVIKGVCDRVVFLDEGHGIAEGAPEELLADPRLAERYFA
jgi:ABC-type branched-subunit amino acid transport system permease subunit/ABC-type branched-subunit amino acid transport system ATPase component